MTIQQTFDFLETSTEVGETGLPGSAARTVANRLPDNSGAQAAARNGAQAASRNATKEASRNGAKETDTSGPAPPENKPDRAGMPDRTKVLDQLRARVGCIQTAKGQTGETFSTGCAAIDRLLPRGGLRRDGITEWVASSAASGAATLGLIAAASAMQPSPQHLASRGPLVVVSSDSGRQGDFFPPAAVALGISADRIIWVRPTRRADLVWAIDQALRCESIAAVWAHVGTPLDDRDARRFQLAAEAGRTPGLLIRPAVTRGRPSFADVRWHIGPDQTTADSVTARSVAADLVSPPRVESLSGRGVKVTLDRCRGGTIGRSVWVQIDDQARVHSIASPPGACENETATLRLASELAHPKSPDREAGRRRA